jgi:hypothetical protein
MHPFPFRPLSAASLALALAFAGLGGARQPAAAEPGTGRAAGRISAVAGASLPTAITLQTTFGSLTLQLTEGTGFEIDEFEGTDENPDADQEAAFRADPTTLVGHYADIWFDRDTGAAGFVDVETRFFTFGPVTGVSEGGTLTVDAAFVGPLNVKVTETTQTSLDFEPVASLSDLQGKMVHLRYDPATNEATEVNGMSDILRLRGTVTGVVPEQFQLNLDTEEGPVEIQVQEFVYLTLDYRIVQLKDLPVGAQVVIDYADADEGPLEASTIQAITPGSALVAGRVQAASPKSQTVTVRVNRGPRRRLHLLKITPATRIWLGNRRISLARVLKGASFEARVAVRNGVALVRSLRVRRAK